MSHILSQSNSQKSFANQLEAPRVLGTQLSLGNHIQQSTTSSSTALNSAMPLQAQSQGIFGGSSIGSVSGCTFQVFNGPVKIIYQPNKRRMIIESEDED